MNHLDASSSVLASVLRDNPPATEVLDSLPYWSIDQRKALLTCCRCQVLPRYGTLLHRNIAHVLSTYAYSPQQRKSVRIRDLILPLNDITSPVVAGFYSMIVKNVPYKALDSVIMELEEGIRKELAAAVEVYHPTTFNWVSLLQGKVSEEVPFHEDYPVLPDLAREVHTGIRRAHRILSLQTLYPDYSRKSVGRDAAVNMTSMLRKLHLEGEEDIISTYGLERIYHESGVEIAGFTEVRWAWKYNDLKPRVYYARGPDQYYSSRYIQEIFNVFIDEFPVTNRFERFHTSSVRGEAQDTCFLYDYSAFTSTLQEVIQFIRALAYVSRGVKVQILDTRYGLETHDLEELLLVYVEKCNEYIPFDPSKLGEYDEESYPLHTCGMLGIPGNISSCTLCHGIHLMQIVKGMRKCKAVGDDAFGWLELLLGDKRSTLDALQNIGRISEAKTEWFGPRQENEGEDSERTWNYVKRPCTRVENRLVTRAQASWPPIEVMLSSSGDFHTVYPPREPREKIKKCANMLRSFVMQFRFMDPEEDEIEAIDRYVRSTIKEMKRRNPQAYAWEGIIYPIGFRGRDVTGDFIDDYWNSRVALPVEYDTRRETEVDVHRECFGRANKTWKILRDMGYVETTMEVDHIVVRDDPDRFERFLAKECIPLYRFVFLKIPPVFLLDLLRRNSTFLHLISMDPSEPYDDE